MRPCLIVVAVVGIVALSGSNSRGQEVTRTSLDLSGEWRDPHGQSINIEQSGNRVTITRNDRQATAALTGTRLVLTSNNRTAKVSSDGLRITWSATLVWTRGADATIPFMRIESGGHAGTCRWLNFTADGTRLISAGDDKVIRIWDVRDPRRPTLDRSIRMQIGFGKEGAIYAGALAPVPTRSGRQLLAIGGFLAPEREDRALENLGDDEADDGNRPQQSAQDDEQDEQEFIGQIRLFDVASGELIGLLDGHYWPVQSLAFSSDGQLLASGSTTGDELMVWDLSPLVSAAAPAENWLEELHSQCVELDHEHHGRIAALRFLPAAGGRRATRLICGSDDGTITFWQRTPAGDWQQRASHVEDGPVASIACLPGGTRVVMAIGGTDEELATVSIYSADGEFQEKLLETDDSVGPLLDASPNGRQLLVAQSPEAWECQIVDATSGEEVASFANHDNDVTAVAFAPKRTDNRALVATSGGDNHEIWLWDPATGQPYSPIAGKGRAVWSLAFSPDNRKLAFGNQYDDEDDGTGYPLQHTFDLATMLPAGSAVAEDADQQWQRAYESLAGLSARISADDPQVLIIEDQQGEAVAEIDVSLEGDDQEAEKEVITCWSFVPASQDIVIGTSEGLYLYDAKTGEEHDNLVGHVGDVNALAISSDGRRLASGGIDQTIRLWNIDADHDDAEMLLTIYYMEDGEWVVWNEDGYYKSSPGGDQLVGWHLNEGDDLAAKFFTAAQYRSRYDRAEIVRLIYRLGGSEAAIEAYNQQSPDGQRPQEVRVPLSQSLEAGPPEIEITAPLDGAVFNAPRATLKFRVHLPEGTRRSQETLYLYVRQDDQPVAGWQRRPVAIGETFHESTAEFTVPLNLLPGSQRVSVMADTENEVRSEVQWVDVSSRAAQRPTAPPTLVVLAVGVSEYSPMAMVTQLNFADDDAQALAEELEKQQGRAFAQVVTKVLPNEQATQKGVKIGFEWLQETVSEVEGSAVVCVLVSGHGGDEGGEYFFIPHDFDGNHAAHVSGLRWSEFLLSLRKIDAPVLLLMDTCHSAGVTGINQTIKDAVDPRYPMRVLVSCPAEQVSYESGAWGHGAFTLAVLEALSGQVRQVPQLVDDEQETEEDEGAERGAQARGRRLGAKPAARELNDLPAFDADGNGEVDWFELQSYVIARVTYLTGGQQEPKVYPVETDGVAPPRLSVLPRR